MIKKFLKDETGLELSEYAVAAALVAMAAVMLSINERVHVELADEDLAFYDFSGGVPRNNWGE